MASQEFLASFAVDIDESGVSRLQSVLEENRDLANEVASAFSAATAAIREYQDAASGNTGGTGEPNRDTGSGQPAGNAGTKAGTNNTAEPDRTGWHYVEEYDRWMPDADTAMRNLAQLQLSGVLTGENAPAVPTTARELVLQNMETMFLGQASRDSANAAKKLISWEDIGLSSDPTAREGYTELYRAAQDLIREPMEQAREYMQQAIDAEEAGQDGSEYIQMVDEVLRKPLEQVKEMVDAFDFDDPSASNEGDGAAGEHPAGVSLDLEGAWSELEAFREEASRPVSLSGNASAIVSAAQAAYSSVRSLFANPIPIRAKVDTDTGDGEEDGGTLQMSAGGRFSRPTDVQVAEDGDAEYIIPVKKENRAVPLLRQLLSELSPSARASLSLDGAGQQLSAGGLAAGAAAAAQITQNNANVSAPVSIQVHASGASAEQIGQSLYDTAERYLLRTLKSAMT